MQLIPALLTNNVLLNGLILLYTILNILACCKNGIFRLALADLGDTHNERLFSPEETRLIKIRPFLLIQYYLFFGLSLFTIVIPEPAETLKGLLTPSKDVYILLGLCIAVPLAWFLFQRFFRLWLCFIFGSSSRMVIFERIYNAGHLLAGPLVMTIFTAIVIGDLSQIVSAILLTSTFIITQLVFVLYGFKIFFKNFSSFCLIFVYLCALEIAPLAVIYVKLWLEK